MIRRPLIIFCFILFGITIQDHHISCPRTVSFWAKHNVLDSQEPWPFSMREQGHEFTETRKIMSGTSTWYQIMKKKKRNLCENAASQWIAFNLNQALIMNQESLKRMIPDPERDGNLIELQNIIENHCSSTTSPSELPSGVIRRVHELNVYFSALNSDLEGQNCILYNDLDCNNNGVRDQCEINHDEFKFICDRQNFNAASFKNCKVDPDITNQEACRVFRSYPANIDQDCNKNKILDSCETSSTSSVSCSNKHCWFVPDGEKITAECAACRSIDRNRDGIPDTCQTGYTPPPMVDCNQNFIEDHIDIFTGISEDTNENGIPDECEIGFYCGTECIDGSLRNLTKIKHFDPHHFHPGDICERNKICPVITRADQIGSCCRRTAPVNPFIVCEDQVTRGYCEDVLGGSFDEHSCQKNICNFRTGSCCSATMDDHCVEDISYNGCKKYFKDFVFDHKHHCGNNNSLCNPNEKRGTCITPSQKCINDITKEGCENLNGAYDYIPCMDRYDIKGIQTGSCCLRDGDCKENTEKYECEEMLGKFTHQGKCSDTCRYTFDERKQKTHQQINQCCMNEEETECEKGRCSFEDELLGYKTTDCGKTESCFHLDNFINGCCLMYDNTTCLGLIEPDHCKFYSGEWYAQDDCLDNDACMGNIIKRNYHSPDPMRLTLSENLRDQDSKIMRLTKELSSNNVNLTGTRTVSTPEQITFTTLFSFAVFTIFVLSSFGYFYILYHPLKKEE